MNDLEQWLRDSLAEHAEQAGPPTPVVERAVAAGARRRRQVRAAVVGVAAALLVAAAVVVPQLDRGGSAPPVTPQPAPSRIDLPTLPADWHQEYWSNISVAVPDSWGYGAAPSELGGQRSLCVDAKPGPYVGRPLMLSDVCGPPYDDAPTADYLWFDAGLPAGTQDLSDGYVRQTVDAYGTMVTVTTNDAALRQQILDTILLQSICPAEMSGPMTSSPQVTAGYLEQARLSSIRACTYRELDGGRWSLAFGAVVPAAKVVSGLLAEAARPPVTASANGGAFGATVLYVTVPTKAGEWPAAPVAVLDYDTGTVRIGGQDRPIVEAGIKDWWVRGMKYVVPSLGVGCGALWSDKYRSGGTC